MNLAGLLVFDDSDDGRQIAERSFGGLRLLERGIRTMARAGVRRLLVVTAPGTRTTVGKVTDRLDLELEFVEWGTKPHMRFGAGEDVLCLFGDHAHHDTSLSDLVADGTGADEVVIQVAPASQQIELLVAQVSDLDASHQMQLAWAPGPVEEASTGAFLVDGALTPHEISTSGAPLIDFLRVRSAGRALRTKAGEAHLWQRVIDRRTARAARAMLFGQVTKATSGPISRHLNARMSIPISKLLIETGISPHMVTVLFVMSTGLTAAYLMSHPMPHWRLALAGFLWQMAAVLDRCDGEIARVKLCESQFGAWFDTVTDNIAYLSAYVAFLVAVTKLHPDQPLFLYAGYSAVLAMLLSLGIMYHYALKTGNGSLQKYLVGYAALPPEQKGVLYRLLERYSFVAKRDFFAFVHFVFAILNQFDMIYLYTVGGLHLMTLGVVISQRKMLTHHAENGSMEPSPGQSATGAAAQDSR